MSDELVDDGMLDFGYPFQCICGAWGIWDNGMECDICGRHYVELVHCPNCPDQGWYAVGSNEDGWEQVPCEFCYTVPNSCFNAHSANT